MAGPTTAIERRGALRRVKQRLHQASFREAIIAAYNGRYAVTGLPELLLLDAAHMWPTKTNSSGNRSIPIAFRCRKSIMRHSTRTSSALTPITAVIFPSDCSREAMAQCVKP
jgi:hypothetical protein